MIAYETDKKMFRSKKVGNFCLVTLTTGICFLELILFY